MYESFYERVDLKGEIKYSQKAKEQIEKNWSNDITKYVIARPINKDPELGELNTPDFEKAVEQFNWLNSEWEEKPYCIFETKTRVLSQEEIDLKLNTIKYNL